MRHLIPSIALLTILPTAGWAQEVTAPASKDAIPLYKEGQVIATDPSVIPDPDKPKVPANAAPKASDTLGLPKLNAIAEDAPDTEAWQAYVNQDYAKARLLAARAGAQGDRKAQLLMGLLLDQGLGGDADPVNAVNWYRQSANNGEARAWLALASMAFDDRGGLTAADGRGFLHNAADAGNVQAMISLGRAYASGMGGPIDDVQAQKWYGNAVTKGSNDARVDLADLKLAAGDQASALKLYKTAVLAGSADAAWKVGILLADPESTVHDYDAARQYLETAAMAGLPSAMTDLGTWYANHHPPLTASAARWYRKAAQADDAAGQYQYAIALAKGDGVQQDRAAAYEWALRAHAHDTENQQYEDLELALEKGMAVTERDAIFAQSKMPLTISQSKQTPAQLDAAYAAQQEQVAADRAAEKAAREQAEAERQAEAKKRLEDGSDKAQ